MHHTSHLPAAEHAARVFWRGARPPGRTACTFTAGAMVRCTGPKALARGVVPCGFPMGTVKPGSRVIVRVVNPKLSPMPHVGKDVTCPDCGSALEEFVVAADAPRLEATG